ncbi:MAG: hypothetical protein ACKOEM_21775 [Planctomycetia bacterium]
MTAARDTFARESVELAWQEQEGRPAVTASCWFDYSPIRHAVRKHVAGNEPWNRILDHRLLERLRAACGRPAAADCRDFVKALSRQLENCCSQPRLCRFQDVEIADVDDRRHPAAQAQGPRAMEKILFVLPSGGVAFVRVEPATTADVTVTVFLTAFFPRHLGWVAPARAASTTVAKYVQKWALHHHPTGGLLHPDPDEAVTEPEEVDNRASHRRWFRFISLKSWGFRRQKDGRWAWIDPHPAR